MSEHLKDPVGSIERDDVDSEIPEVGEEDYDPGEDTLQITDIHETAEFTNNQDVSVNLMEFSSAPMHQPFESPFSIQRLLPSNHHNSGLSFHEPQNLQGELALLGFNSLNQAEDEELMEFSEENQSCKDILRPQTTQDVLQSTDLQIFNEPEIGNLNMKEHLSQSSCNSTDSFSYETHTDLESPAKKIHSSEDNVENVTYPEAVQTNLIQDKNAESINLNELSKSTLDCVENRVVDVNEDVIIESPAKKIHSSEDNVVENVTYPEAEQTNLIQDKNAESINLNELSKSTLDCVENRVVDVNEDVIIKGGSEQQTNMSGDCSKNTDMLLNDESHNYELSNQSIIGLNSLYEMTGVDLSHESEHALGNRSSSNKTTDFEESCQQGNPNSFGERDLEFCKENELSYEVITSHSILSTNNEVSFQEVKGTDFESIVKSDKLVLENIDEDKNKSCLAEISGLKLPPETEIKQVLESQQISENIGKDVEEDIDEVFEDAVCFDKEETDDIPVEKYVSISHEKLSKETSVAACVKDEVIDEITKIHLVEEDKKIQETRFSDDFSKDELSSSWDAVETENSSKVHIGEINNKKTILEENSLNNVYVTKDEQTPCLTNAPSVHQSSQYENNYVTDDILNAIDVSALLMTHNTTLEETHLKPQLQQDILSNGDSEQTEVLDQDKRSGLHSIDELAMVILPQNDNEQESEASNQSEQEFELSKEGKLCGAMTRHKKTIETSKSIELEVENKDIFERMKVNLCTIHENSYNSKSFSEVVQADFDSDKNDYEFQLQKTEEEKSTINCEETGFKLPEEARTVQVLETQQNYNDLIKDKDDDIFEDATSFKAEQVDYVIENEPSIKELSKNMPVLDCDKDCVVDKDHKIVGLPEKEEIIPEGLLSSELTIALLKIQRDEENEAASNGTFKYSDEHGFCNEEKCNKIECLSMSHNECASHKFNTVPVYSNDKAPSIVNKDEHILFLSHSGTHTNEIETEIDNRMENVIKDTSTYKTVEETKCETSKEQICDVDSSLNSDQVITSGVVIMDPVTTSGKLKQQIVMHSSITSLIEPPHNCDPMSQKSLPYENYVAVFCPSASNSNEEAESPLYNTTAPLCEKTLEVELPKSVISESLKNDDFSNYSDEIKTYGNHQQEEITMQATDTLDVSMNMSMTFIGGVIDTSLPHDVQPTVNISHLQAVSDDFYKDKNYVQNNHLLQNVTDFVNSNIAETNEFTTYLDQKMCDALYVPLSSSNEESNPSTCENGLQSFMEITMASTNPAIFDQSTTPYSYSQIVSQSRRNFCEEKSTEENGYVRNESTNSVVLMELKENNEDGSTSRSSLDFSSCGSSHEILQQSMSDYVTNRSFNLAIPDCDPDQNSTQDNELRKQCERQAENVLLMKWPAHFHDQFNALKNENQLLLEQLETFKQNDVCISNLKQENLELYNKLQEITNLFESQTKTLRDFELVGQFKLNSNYSQLIVELTEENNKLKELNEESKTMNSSLKEENQLLWNELKKDIEKLDKLKLDNERLLKELEDNNSEICCLKSDRKKLKNVLIKANDKLNDLESENEYLKTLLQESNIQNEELNAQVQSMTVLREENKQLVLEIKSLKDCIESFEGESAIFMQDLSSLGETISSLLEDKRVLMQQLADLADLNERITELTSEKQHFIQHISNVEHNVSKLQKENCVLMVQLESVTEKYSEITELNELVRELESHVSSLNEELMSEVTKNDLILMINKDLEDHIIEINEDKTSMQNSVSILKQTLLSENHNLKSQLDTIQQTINDLEKQTACLNEELQNEAIKNHTLLSKNELLESKINEISEDKLQLQNSISLLQQNLVDIQTQNNLAKDQLSEFLRGKEQALDEEKLNLMSGNEQLKCEIKNTQDTVNKLHNQIAILNEQLKQEESKQRALIITNDDLQNQILQISEEKFRLECSLSELEQNLVDLQAQSSLSKEQLTEIFKQKEQTLLEENQNLISENEQFKCEIKNIQETMNNLQNQLVLINEELEQEESKQQALKTTNDDLQNQILLISEEKSRLECSLSELEQNLVDLQAQSSLAKEQLTETFRQKEQTLLDENQNLISENDHFKSEIKNIQETMNNLQNQLVLINEELEQEESKQQALKTTNDDLQNQILLISEEKSRLECSLSELEQNLVDLQAQSSLAKEQLTETFRQKEQTLLEENQNLISENEQFKCEIKNIQETMNNLQNQLVLVNDELKQEESKQQALKTTNDDLQNQILLISEEKSRLECYLSELELNLVNLQAESNLAKEQCTEHLKAKEFILESNKDLEQKCIVLNEAKFELENKLEMALAKETNILSLEEENKNLSEKLQTLVGNEEVIELLKNEKLDLELQIKNLSDSVDKLLSDNKGKEIYVKDNSDLRLTMLQEIQSLTGETDSSDLTGCPILNVYQKLMSEFLTKEKEVIFALQNECETKIKTKEIEIDQLKGVLEEKQILSSQLIKDIEELRVEVGEHITSVINLKNELHTVKNELVMKEKEMSEVKDELMIVKNEKASLVIELNSQHNTEVAAELEDKIQFLNNEINCKTDEICDLNSEIMRLKSVHEDFIKQSEPDKHLLNQQQQQIEELTSKLKYTEESLAEMIQSKFQEINKLNEGLESKQKELEEFADKIKELTLVKTKLYEVESEIGFILQCFNSMNDDFDMHEALLRCSHHCQSLAEVMKLVNFSWTNITAKFESLNANLKSELEKRVEVCGSVEIQINCLNEELKAHKVLYDEHILQFKEEITAKNAVVTDLTDSNSKLKKECDDLVAKINKMERQTKDVKELHEEIKKLKEDNHNLAEASRKFNVFKEVNKKLSLEIEDLSRSIKFEKQSNSELKTKYDTANYQLAELRKENFSLEDKIEVLENKLLNHDIISSIKIAFPYNMSTIDKQVTFINEKLGELEQVKSQFENLLQDHNNLKHEHEKSTEYIKRQEEKLSKILKRELDLKKQIVSSTQNSLAEHKILEELKSQLVALFPDEDNSLNRVVANVKGLIEENKSLKQGSPAEIEELKRLLEEAKQENKDLDNECEMMHKHIKEQEELLASVLKREEELKKLNSELKTQVINVTTSTPTENFDELLMMFPEKPPSLSKALELVKNSLTENQSLKEKVAETQKECADMDKECEDMYKAYQEKEKELVDVLKREAKYVEDMKVKEEEFVERLKQLSEELREAKYKLTTNPSKPADCQCEVLKSRLAELKLDVADRNAKITALELQFEADNFPIKKKAADLEKSLDQAKHKISELKAEVRRYQEQMHEVTVGLRTECERCRRDAALREESGAQTSPSATADTTILAQKTKEIAILKALCKSRNQRIAELEQGINNKPSRILRSALKEGKENSNPPPTPL